MDIMTREGGYRKGSIVEWFGHEGIAKTRGALQQSRIAQVWAPDKSVAFFDVEGGVDLYQAEHDFRIDMGQFPDGSPKFAYYPHPDTEDIPTTEDYMNRISLYAASGLFSLIVVDSLAAMLSGWEKKQDDITATKTMGSGLILSSAFRKLKPIVQRSGTIILIINQVRTYTEQTAHGPMSVDKPSGGHALRFAATHRFKADWKTKAKDEGDFYRLKVHSWKVKYGRSDMHSEIPVLDGKFEYYADLVECAVRYGVVVLKGSWYQYQDSPIGQGLVNAADSLRTNAPLADAIRTEVLAKALPVEEESENEEEVTIGVGTE
jgi:recombination protein RecA